MSLHNDDRQFSDNDEVREEWERELKREYEREEARSRWEMEMFYGDREE